MRPCSKSSHEEAKTAQWGGERGHTHTPPLSPLRAIKQVKGIPLALLCRTPSRRGAEGRRPHLLLLSTAFHSQGPSPPPTAQLCPPALPPHFPCLKAPRGAWWGAGCSEHRAAPKSPSLLPDSLWWQGAGCREEQRPHCWARPGEQRDSWFPPRPAIHNAK